MVRAPDVFRPKVPKWATRLYTFFDNKNEYSHGEPITSEEPCSACHRKLSEAFVCLFCELRLHRDCQFSACEDPRCAFEAALTVPGVRAVMWESRANTASF